MIRHVCNECDGDVRDDNTCDCPTKPRPSGLDICAEVIRDFVPSNPVQRGGLDLYALIADDLRARQAKGIATYGDTLRVDTPIDALQFELEELLDAMCYARMRWEQTRGTQKEYRHRDRYTRRMQDVIDLRLEMWEAANG